jgi:membrane protease subunit HflK
MNKVSINENLFSSFRQTAVFGGWILLMLFILYLASGIYIIRQNQVGVLQRWGRVVNRSVSPGIHYALPWPVHRINKVPTKVMHRISVDDFCDSSDPDSKSVVLYETTGLGSYCVSGDNNLVNLVCVIQYSIDEPIEYLFNIRDNERALLELAAASIIRALAAMPIDVILTSGKLEVESNIKSGLQAKLDALGAGLNVSFVEVKDVSPPTRVRNAFEDVINAQIDKKKMINDAESYKNQKIPQATADAAAMTEEAKGYKNEVIANAEGETARFLALLAEYKKAPGVTRRRIYLETLAEVFQAVKRRYIVDEDSNNYRLFVP